MELPPFMCPLSGTPGRPVTLGMDFVNFFYRFLWDLAMKTVGIFGEFSVVSVSWKQSTKSPQKFGENSEPTSPRNSGHFRSANLLT